MTLSRKMGLFIDLFIGEIIKTCWNLELNNVRGINCFQLTPPILPWIRGKEPNIDNVMKMMFFLFKSVYRCFSTIICARGVEVISLAFVLTSLCMNSPYSPCEYYTRFPRRPVRMVVVFLQVMCVGAVRLCVCLQRKRQLPLHAAAVQPQPRDPACGAAGWEA